MDAATRVSRPPCIRLRASTKRDVPARSTPIGLELKLLADVGLVGYPNVGKSTLISRISAARPKIADYPFTTLEPNLGVVAVGDARDEISFVVADIPGLIEGAHTGAGLGTQFLRHIERTRLLVHLVDVSDASGRHDVAKDVEVILGELASFGAHLEEKPMIMVASKIDVANKDKLAQLKRYCKKHKLKLYEISAVTGKGIEELKYAIAENVQELRDQSGAGVECGRNEGGFSSGSAVNTSRSGSTEASNFAPQAS